MFNIKRVDRCNLFSEIASLFLLVNVQEEIK